MREIIRSKTQQVCRGARLRLVSRVRRQASFACPSPAAQKVTEIGRRSRLTGSGISSDGIVAVPDVEEIRIVVAPEPG